MIRIDGSYGEGGGQIIRSALALSAVTGKEFTIENIRAGRPNPGLQKQHITSVKAVADICNAVVEDTSIGSTSFSFKPGKIIPGKYSWDIGSAGSVTLVLQALLPAALHCEKEFEFKIKGGTNVNWAPPVEHFQHVFCDYLKKMGAEINFSVIKHGFYPNGGGIVSMHVKPSVMKELVLEERGALEKIDVWSIASQDIRKARVAERQADEFLKYIGKSTEKNIIKNNILYVDSDSTGSSIHAHAHFKNCKIGAECIGEKNKKAEIVGRECAEILKKEMVADSTADSHTTDQLLIYIGLYGGSLKFPLLTQHAKTNMWIIEQFLDAKFLLKGNVVYCDV